MSMYLHTFLYDISISLRVRLNTRQLEALLVLRNNPCTTSFSVTTRSNKGQFIG